MPGTPPLELLSVGAKVSLGSLLVPSTPRRVGERGCRAQRLGFTLAPALLTVQFGQARLQGLQKTLAGGCEDQPCPQRAGGLEMVTPGLGSWVVGLGPGDSNCSLRQRERMNRDDTNHAAEARKQPSLVESSQTQKKT